MKLSDDECYEASQLDGNDIRKILAEHIKQVVTANLAPHPIARCCHLATARSQCSRYILKV